LWQSQYNFARPDCCSVLLFDNAGTPGAGSSNGTVSMANLTLPLDTLTAVTVTCGSPSTIASGTLDGSALLQCAAPPKTNVPPPAKPWLVDEERIF